MPISPHWFYGSDYLFVVLCAALALEFLVGGLPGFRQVLSFLRTISIFLAHRVGRRLNRQNRSTRSRRMRGALLVFVLVPLSAIFGLHAAEFCRSLADGWIVETVLVAMCVGLQRPFCAVRWRVRALSARAIPLAAWSIMKQIILTSMDWPMDRLRSLPFGSAIVLSGRFSGT